MLPQATWKVAELHRPTVDLISSKLNLDRITAGCLVNRGLTTIDAINLFLEPKLGNLDPLDKMIDLKKAAIRTTTALSKQEIIGVFGDYDVDGLTSTALVTSFLNELGARVEVEVANRFSSGYGLSPNTVADMHRRGCTLLVVLDCGTSDHEAMDHAAQLGLDVVIVDHHRIEDKHPNVYAFVNPHRADCEFEDKNMAAVGLAFYFAAAVRARLVEEKRIDRSSIDPRSLLDLVALGTIADVVSLTGNNRILASHGLALLSTNRKPGIAALMASARVRSRKIRADHISYQLAPRINAAGRLANAMEAYRLLIASNRQEAESFAESLEKLTTKRRVIEEDVTKNARLQVTQNQLFEKSAIVVSGDDWHKGVIGIVAARLAEEFGKPAYVISFEDETGTGSARAQGQISLYASLAGASDTLIRYGGHKDAAGFSLHRDKKSAFTDALLEYARKEVQDFKVKEITCDAKLNPSQITTSLLNEIDRLGPFGNGNPEPVFDIAKLDVLQSKVVGVNHLKLELKTPSGSISAFGPRMGTYADKIPHMIRVAASLTEDEWKRDGSPELRLAAPPADCDD